EAPRTVSRSKRGGAACDRAEPSGVEAGPGRVPGLLRTDAGAARLRGTTAPARTSSSGWVATDQTRGSPSTGSGPVRLAQGAFDRPGRVRRCVRQIRTWGPAQGAVR